MKASEFNKALFTEEKSKKERKLLEKCVEAYPWFVLPGAALIKERERRGERTTELRTRYALNFLGNSYFPIIGGVVSQKIVAPEIIDMIDTFIGKNVGRIRPEKADANYVNENLAEEVELDIVTEDLAKIYLSQGLKEEAIDIYRKLSLKIPEKSSYFAQIIETIPLMDKKGRLPADVEAPLVRGEDDTQQEINNN